MALVVGLAFLATWDEITEQHYYRARFAHKRMYIPVVVGPLAVVASLARAVSSSAPARATYRLAALVALAVGLLGAAFHWTGNLRKYREKAEQDALPGETDSTEDQKHGRPEPDIDVAGYNVGQLLEVGARGRPWMAPLALTGLGTIALVAEGASRSSKR
jgi:hypothetical protein